MQLVELLHRHVLLRAGQGARDLLVDPVVEDAVARLARPGVARDQLVEGRLRRRASSPTARPRISTPWAANSSGSTRLASLPSSSSPSESASRFAGSIVSTQTFSPRAAIPVAIAAEVVVLPTPPEPAQMQTSLPSRSSLDRRHQARASCAQASRGLDVELRLEEEGQGLDRRLDAAAQAGQLGALASGRARARRSRPARRRPPGAIRRARRALPSRAASSLEKRSG